MKSAKTTKRIPEAVSKYFSVLAKKGHKRKPRTKAFYRDMQKKSMIARRKKISTGA